MCYIFCPDLGSVCSCDAAWCVLCFAPTINLKVHQSFVRVPVENSLLKSWLRKSYNLQLFLNLPFQNTTTKATTMPNTLLHPWYALCMLKIGCLLLIFGT
jgi:hypothetical protein